MKQEFRLTQAPRQVYAAVGASLVVRDEAVAVPSRLAGAFDRAGKTKDRLVTTAAQVGFEAQERMLELPSEVASGPGRLLRRFRGTVVDLRDGAGGAYAGFAASGERALEEWQAERLINRRVDRVKQTVTPRVARATVSARASHRQAAQSAAGRRVRQFSAKARSSVERNWEEYLAAVDESAPTNAGGGTTAVR